MVDCRCVLQPDRASSAKHHESRQRVLVFCRIWKWAGGEGREILLIAEKLTYMLQPNVIQAPCGAGGREPPPPLPPANVTPSSHEDHRPGNPAGSSCRPQRGGQAAGPNGGPAAPSGSPRPRLKKKQLLARPHCPSSPRPFPNPAEYQDSLPMLLGSSVWPNNTAAVHHQP